MTLIGAKHDVLDDGFVRVVDIMGDDSSIVQAARISYGSGTKSVHEDRGLIRYLMRHRHSTPFEMCEIKLHVRVPMDCWRQWIRHRTANVNEYSTRYSEAIDERQCTSANEWRAQSKSNNQGSEDFPIDFPDDEYRAARMLTWDTAGDMLTEKERQLHEHCKDVYEERLACGVAREQARKDLPLSTYTEAYWKIDLHNLLHFLSLRMDSHAQWEIRQYATVIGEQIVKQWVPHTWEAFEDYRLNGMFLTGPEVQRLKNIIEWVKYGELNEPTVGPNAFENDTWFQRKDDGKLKRNRERSEFASKLERIGIETWGWN